MATAGRLPAEAGAELLEAARGAFVQSLEVAAICSAAIVVAMAVIVAARLRRGSGRRGADHARLEADEPVAGGLG